MFVGAPLFISRYHTISEPPLPPPYTDPLAPLFTPSSPPIGKSLTPLLPLIPSPPPCYRPDHTDASTGGASLNCQHDGRHVPREWDRNNGRGMDTRPGAAPSPPLLCLRLGGRAVTATAAATAIVVVLLSLHGIIKSPLFSATGPRSAAFRRWQADAAAAAAVIVIVIAQDLQVIARRCNGSSIHRRPSFSRDGNGGGGGY